jgi:hypothetical protein
MWRWMAYDAAVREWTPSLSKMSLMWPSFSRRLQLALGLGAAG